MKKLLFLAVIAAVIFPASSLFAEEENLDENIEQLEKRIEIKRLEMEFAEMDLDRDYNNQMRQIELDHRRAELENQGKEAGYHHRRHHKGCGLILLICLVVHILTAVWVYQDIRDRKKGSGIWIVIAILTGLFGTLVYAVVRAGEGKNNES